MAEEIMPIEAEAEMRAQMRRTVHEIPDADLLRRVVHNIVTKRPRRQEFAWAAVSDAFGLGSTFAAQLCRRFGLDPDSGKDLPATEPKP